jgi:hypothetical protein
MAAYRWQGKSSTDHGVGLIESSLCDEFHISGDVYLYRTGTSARSLILKWLPVHQGPCGAHLHTRGAKTAGRFSECGAGSPYKDTTFFIEYEVKGLHPANLSTDPHAAVTANTQIVVSFKERLVL